MPWGHHALGTPCRGQVTNTSHATQHFSPWIGVPHEQGEVRWSGPPQPTRLCRTGRREGGKEENRGARPPGEKAYGLRPSPSSGCSDRAEAAAARRRTRRRNRTGERWATLRFDCATGYAELIRPPLGNPRATTPFPWGGLSPKAWAIRGNFSTTCPVSLWRPSPEFRTCRCRRTFPEGRSCWTWAAGLAWTV